MRPWSVAAACLLARSYGSWVFPPGLEDGDYTVTLPPPGSDPGQAAIFTKRAPPNDTLARRALAKRGPPDMSDFFDPDPPPPPRRTDEYQDEVPLPVTACLCRYDSWPFPPRLYQDARKNFEAYCDAYLVPSHTIHVSVANNGTVGIFVCNLAKNLQPCSIIEYKWAEDNIMDPLCQSHVPSQVELRPWLKWYGRVYPNDFMCGVPIRTMGTPKSRRPEPKKQIIKGMPKFLKPTAEKPLFDEPVFDIPSVDDGSEAESEPPPESEFKSEFDDFDPEPKWEAVL